MTFIVWVISLCRLAHPSVTECSDSLNFSRTLPVFSQATPYTCGPTVILSLLAKRGILRSDLTDVEIGRMLGSNPEFGTSPQMMVDGLSKFGLSSRIVLSTQPQDFFNTLDHSKDYILLVRDGQDAHWVALSGVRGNRVKLMDPWNNQGQLKTLSLKTLISRWRKVRYSPELTYDYLSIEVPIY